MKKWRCKVCGYEHEGDLPPLVCPICGVGPEEFVLVEEKVIPQGATKKQWKCTVCDYVHEGDEPPETCPLCGVGREFFVLLEDTIGQLSSDTIYKAGESTARAALDKLSYGLYVVTSLQESVINENESKNRINGQCCNTVFQLTDEPLQIAVCLNKKNLTHEYLESSGVLAISVLEEEDRDMVRRFGYKSGRNVDKFAGIEYINGQNGCPIISPCVAYLEGNMLRDKTVDVGTHSLFIVKVTAGMVVSNKKPLTYAYFRANKKS